MNKITMSANSISRTAERYQVASADKKSTRKIVPQQYFDMTKANQSVLAALPVPASSTMGLTLMAAIPKIESVHSLEQSGSGNTIGRKR